MLDFLYPDTWWEWALIGASIVLTLLPPKYDPAIRWKERQERKRRGK